MSSTTTALIRCDASPEIGLGHLMRCLSIANALADECGVTSIFAMRPHPLADQIIGGRYRVVAVPQSESYGVWLADTIRSCGASLLIADVRDHLTASDLQMIRTAGTLVAVIDDISERRLAADLVFYPPVPQVREADWCGFIGQMFSGWEWVILRPGIPRASRKRHAHPASPPSLLVTMGGTDPVGMTLQAVRALDQADFQFSATIMAGPGFMHYQELQDLLGRARREFVVCRNLDDLPFAMADADLALCSFGVSAYELAAAGTPAIYLCLTADHAQSASALSTAGVGLSLGVFDAVHDKYLMATVGKLLSNREQLAKMREACRIIDGQGAARVARQLVSCLSS